LRKRVRKTFAFFFLFRSKEERKTYEKDRDGRFRAYKNTGQINYFCSLKKKKINYFFSAINQVEFEKVKKDKSKKRNEGKRTTENFPQIRNGERDRNSYRR